MSNKPSGGYQPEGHNVKRLGPYEHRQIIISS